MALEAAALYQQQELFVHSNPYPLLLESWSTSSELLPTHCLKDCDHEDVLSFDCYSFENQPNQLDWHSHNYDYGIITNNESNLCPPPPNEWGINSSPEELKNIADDFPIEVAMRRARRRRAKVKKNKEDIENQRMTHIAVERNRRKQMNEYLNVLRSLMPDSHVQRGDQASIVGGAINFVKELEQNLQCLSAKKQMKENNNVTSTLPFEEFFTFPQYTSGGNNSGGDSDQVKGGCGAACQQQLGGGSSDSGLAADVEVTMVDSHANLKIRLKRPIKQLSKLVSGLTCLRLTILHLNVNTATDGVVLYSFSLKVEEDGSVLRTVDDIAEAVYQLLGRIQEV